MKKLNEICVIIQARLGSQRVPQKMIRPIGDTTLLDIAIEKIKQCSSFPHQNFYLSAWEPEIKKIGNKQGVNIFNRSEKSAKSC